MKKAASGKRHYAWTIFFVCTIAFISTVGVQLSTQGLFYQPVAKALNISVGMFTLTGIFTGAGNALMLSFTARILQKYNVRLVYGIALAMYGLLYFSMSLFTRLWMWYVASFVMGMCYSFVGIPMLSYLMNRWFATKKSTMLGLSTSISSFIIIFATMLASSVIENYGWRACYVAFGLFIFLIGAPTVAIFVRRDPQEMGQLPYGTEQVPDTPVKPREYDVRIRLFPGEKPLLVLVIILMMCMSFSQCFVAHLASYGTSIGYAQMASATLISCANAGNLGAKLVISPLNEKYGAKRMTMILVLMIACAQLLLIFGTKVRILVMLGSAVCGMALMIGTVQIPVVVWDMFDTKRYTPIYNAISIGTLCVTTLSGSVVGLIYSAFDSYAPCMTLGFVTMMISAILLPTVYRMRKKIPAGQEVPDTAEISS